MPVQPNDEFKDLPISNQAKWLRRNPEKRNAMKRAYRATPQGKAADKRYYLKRRNKYLTSTE